MCDITGSKVIFIYEIIAKRLVKLKAKAVPLHPTQALRWRGCIAPTHSRTRH
jgi:hypothetical protein